VVFWSPDSVEPGNIVLLYCSGNKFRVALDRTWPAATYLAVRHPGTDKIRAVVQPAQLSREGHTEGIPQTITFDKIPDVKVGTKSIQLVAKSDAGLPVSYFVVVGPAMVNGDSLVFTKIPSAHQIPNDRHRRGLAVGTGFRTQSQNRGDCEANL